MASKKERSSKSAKNTALFLCSMYTWYDELSDNTKFAYTGLITKKISCIFRASFFGTLFIFTDFMALMQIFHLMPFDFENEGIF